MDNKNAPFLSRPTGGNTDRIPGFDENGMDVRCLIFQQVMFEAPLPSSPSANATDETVTHARERA